MKAPPRPSFLELCCEEPYRIFFPLGILFGLSGVSLWPLYFSGLHKFYPGIMHARLMIEGFLGAFIVGFLGTAGPRLTGTAPLSRGELGCLLALLVGAAGTHIAERYQAGDSIFLILLLFFAARLGGRFFRRTALPPPGLVLVAFGFFNAVLGICLLLIGPLGNGYPRCLLLGSLLLHQGFVLSLVLGIGAFLLPRFLQLPAGSEEAEDRNISPQWKRRALLAAGTGAVLLAGFMIEIFAEAPRIAGLIRLTAAAVFLAVEIPWHRAAVPSTTMARSLQAAIVLLLLGLLFPVLWPLQRVAGLHLIFIGGFTLIAFTVAARVVLGHGGYEFLFTQSLPFLQGAAGLLIVAAVLRVAGDFFPISRASLLDFAVYLWMLAAGLWSWRVFPKMRRAAPAISS